MQNRVDGSHGGTLHGIWYFTLYRTWVFIPGKRAVQEPIGDCRHGEQTDAIGSLKLGADGRCLYRGGIAR